jgi:LuxR family transcriptional regulator, maltose regulon positive regulatory protein
VSSVESTALSASAARSEPPAPSQLPAGRDESLFIVDSSLRVLHARDRWSQGAPAGGPAPMFEELVPGWAAGPVRDAVRGSLSGTATDLELQPASGGAPLAVTASPVHSHEGDVVASVVVLREAPAPTAAGDATIPRRALLLSLARTPAAVVVLRAPAGYGKTTLLRQWDVSDARPFAWAAVGPDHNDPDALSAAIAAALAGAAGMPRRGRRAGVEAFLAREGAGSQVLVLDDAHHLTASSALAMVERIARGLPDGSQLVLSSREELDGAVARLIRSLSVMRLDANDLSMSASEGRALFEAAGLHVPAEQVESAVRRTGGWPLGLQVMMLGARLHGVADEQIGLSDVPEQVVGEVLREEFVRPLPDEDQEFLAITSVAERLNGDLCDAMLGVEGSAETLRRLERSNLPVVGLDETGEWYRLQGLFRDMLLDDLTRRRPATVRRAHQRASAWLERLGDTAAATHHAKAAGELDQAGRLLLELASRSLLTRDEAVTGITDRFTRAEVRDEPALAAAFGWITLGRGDVDQAASYAALGRSAQTDAPRAETAAAPLELLDAVIAADGCEAMRDRAAAAAVRAPEGSAWEVVSRYVQGAAMQLAGDAEACDRLEQARRLGDLLPPEVRALTNAQLALAMLGDDDRADAQARAEEARELAGGDGVAAALSDALLALLRAKAGSDSAARERYAAAVATIDSSPEPPPWLRALTLSVLCRAAVQLGNGNEARGHLEAARAAWPQGRRDAAGLNAELDALAATLDAFPAVSLDRAGHLTPAELRVLRLLPTHLSFREIGDHLFLSRHTVKTEAISTYRKLGVTSRSEAVRRAGELGLL